MIKLLVEDASKKLTKWKQIKTTATDFPNRTDLYTEVSEWVSSITKSAHVDFSGVAKIQSGQSQPSDALTNKEMKVVNKYVDGYSDNGIAMFALALKSANPESPTAEVEYFSSQKAFFWILRQNSDGPLAYVPQLQPAFQYLPDFFRFNGGIGMNNYFRVETPSTDTCSDRLRIKPFVQKSDIVVAGNNDLLGKLLAFLVAYVVKGMLKKSENKKLTNEMAQEALRSALADYLLAILQPYKGGESVLKEIRLIAAPMEAGAGELSQCPLNDFFWPKMIPDQAYENTNCAINSMKSKFDLKNANQALNNVNLNIIATSLVDAASILISVEKYAKNYLLVLKLANQYIETAINLKLSQKEIFSYERLKYKAEDKMKAKIKAYPRLKNTLDAHIKKNLPPNQHQNFLPVSLILRTASLLSSKKISSLCTLWTIILTNQSSLPEMTTRKFLRQTKNSWNK